MNKYTFPLLFLLVVPACINNTVKTNETKVLMDTFVEIKTEGRSKVDLAPVWNEADRLIKLFNYYDKDSEVARINLNAGLKPVEISTETIEVFTKAIKYSELSGGLFDITINPLITLWSKAAKEKVLPSNTRINETLSYVNYKDIKITKNSIMLQKKGMSVNLGGIAKGYIVDKMIEKLKQLGAEKGMVNAGGDLSAFGDKNWKVAVQHPRNLKEVFASLYTNNRSIVTSGDYERYFELDGKRYHHILDPKTGYPGDKAVSVTIISDKATDSVVIAKVLFLMGKEQGMEFMNSMSPTDYIFVDKEGNVLSSDKIKNFLPKKINLKV